MRRLSMLLCLGALASGAARADSGQLRAPGSGQRIPIEMVASQRLEGLESWLKAVARHTPGEDDDALQEIAAWPNANLKNLWVDANVLSQIIRSQAVRAMIGRPVLTRFSVIGEGQKTSTAVHYTKTQFRRMTVLACAAGGVLIETQCMAMGAAVELDPELRQIAILARAAKLRDDPNYIMRRGAILHSDVAILAPLSMKAPGETRPTGMGLERFRMEISDGREIDLSQSAVHWEIARMLLDFVVPPGGDRPAAGRDDMVRQWYRATASWMQLKEDHDNLHLQRARKLFPSDPDILFLSACQRETYAGPPIQTAVRSAVLPTGVVIDVGSDRAELREAEALFRRVLDVRSDFAEARLRYGRVLDLLGKHAEAAAELRKAIGGLTDRQLLYYGGMFLGAAEEALGNRDAARVGYEQSAELYPMAQSPLLALSQLARRYGDRGGALRAIDRLFALPEADLDAQTEPWWSYYVAQARDADDLLEAMHRPYLAERLQ
jgi:tetratricopeptide (TPR) repeat protein